jgi:hypothetical protein
MHPLLEMLLKLAMPAAFAALLVTAILNVAIQVGALNFIIDRVGD